MSTKRLVARIVALIQDRPLLPQGISVGRNVHLGKGVKFDYSHGHHILIEDDVTVVDGTRILCHDAASVRRTGLGWIAPVVLRHGAFVGADALIMPGVTIGENAVVGAGSVVTNDVPAGTVVAGVPARPIGTTDQLDAKRTKNSHTYPVFETRTHNQHPLNEDVLQQLHEACRLHGGYFLRDE